MSRTVTYNGHHTRVGALALFLSAVVLPACAALAPLRDPPLLTSNDPMNGVTTRDEAIARFGPPYEVRSSDDGDLLIYRRLAVVDVNPSRYYGEDRGDRFNRYELLLVHVDLEGRVVRWTIEPE